MDLEVANFVCPPTRLRHCSAHLGVIGYQAVLADVNSVFEAEQVRHLPLGALAKSHGRS